MGVERHITVYRPLRDWLNQAVARRETLRILIWKDIRVQYGDVLLGLMWAVFQPLVYLLAIGALLRFGSTDVATGKTGHTVFLFSGIIVWNFISSSVTSSVNGIFNNSDIVSKVYFPRIYLILAPMARCALDFAVSFSLLILLALAEGMDFSPSLAYQIPLMVLLLSCTSLGLASIASVAVVANRHVRHLIPVMMYAGLFIFPVFHTLQGIQDHRLSGIYHDNPVSASMTLLRSAMGIPFGHDSSIPVAVSAAIAVLLTGVLSFKRMEKQLADRI